ncbi:transcription antitermination factor NusB, partial [Salmonella enterica]
LGQVEKAVLRIALFELSKRSDVPYKVAINEAIEELGQVEKAVLRIALFELSKRSDVPYKVAINEAIE